MKQPDALELFWNLAHADNPVLMYDDVMRFPQAVREVLLDARLLRPTQTATSVECDGCDLGHVAEVIRFTYPDGQTRLFIMCPECGRVPIRPERLHQWVPDYAVVADPIAEALQTRGGREEIVSDRLWKLGRAALAGQSRPVWLVRRLDDELRRHLPSDNLSVAFMLGIRLRADPGIDEDRVFEIKHLVDLVDGELRLDTGAVRGQLAEMARTAPPRATPRRKDSNRAEAIKVAKRELHAHIISMKSMLAKTDMRPPRLTQRALAERIGQTPSTLSRILNEENDELLTILWDTANESEAIRNYSRKLG